MPDHGRNGSPYSDPKMVRGLFQGVRLSREQRQRHWQRLERRFRPNPPASDRAHQMREFAAIGLLLVAAVFVVWAWNELLGVQDSDPPDVAEEAVVETRPAESSSDRDVTPTPEPTQNSNAEHDDGAYLCTDEDVTEILTDFVAAFNDGDADTLSDLLPAETSARAPSYPQYSDDQRALHRFEHHGEAVWIDRDEIVDYLLERFQAGEYWEIDDLQFDEFRQARSEMPEVAQAYALLDWNSKGFGNQPLHVRFAVNCVEDSVISWQQWTVEPQTADGIPVDEFLAVAAPLESFQGRSTRMIIATDRRSDGGAMTQWLVHREQGVTREGEPLELVRVGVPGNLNQIRYVQGLESWYLDQRGWEAAGTLPDAPTLPLEVRMAQGEPEMTAELIREHLDDIPETGSVTLTRDLSGQSEAGFVWAQSLESPIVEHVYEVEIEDGAVVRSRYRVVDEAGNKLLMPETQFLEMARSNHNHPDPSLLRNPGRQGADDYHYRVPDDLPDEMSFQSQQRHEDGMSETYQLRWGNVSLGLLVTPSRGGLDPRFSGDRSEWDTNQIEVQKYSVGALMWQDPDDAGYPTRAIWDTGSYRFSLTVQADELPPGAEWSDAILLEVVEALSQSSGPGDE